MNATIAALEDAGATIVDPARIPIEPAYGPEFAALLCEFKDDIAGYLGTYTGASYPKTLQDLIDFNNAHPDLEGPWNSLIFDLAQATGGRADPDCVAARATGDLDRAGGDRRHAGGEQPRRDHRADERPRLGDRPGERRPRGDFSTFVGSSSPSAIAGYANITVPAGYVGPLPVGVSFIGRRWDEPKLIAFAYAFEQATHVRVPPTFIDSIRARVRRGPAARSMQRAVVPGRDGAYRLMPLR